MAGDLSALSLFAPRTDVESDGRSLFAPDPGGGTGARTASLAAASMSMSHEVFDSLEISGAFSGSLSQDSNGGITFNSDGTYNISATMVHRETFSFEASFVSAEIAEAGAAESGGTQNSLRNVMTDVREAFRSILEELRNSIAVNRPAPRAARMTLPGPQQNNPLSNLGANIGDKELLRGYLALLRHFAGEFGDNPAIDRAIASLEEFLGDEGTEGAEGVAQSAGVQSIQSMQINLSIQVTNITQISVSFGANGQQVQQGDPLVIDMDGDGIEISSLAEGVRFDLNGDGRLERTAFATGGDGVLALDRNGDGIINSGRELFGDQHGAAHGFAELSRYDDNNDRVIDSSDSVYSRLRVWADANRDGVSQQSELRSLQELNIRSLSLDWQDDNRSVNGNRIAQSGAYIRNDGTQGTMADVLLNYIA